MAPLPQVLVDLPEALIGPRVVVRPYAEAEAGVVSHAVEESRATLARWMPWAKQYQSPEDYLVSIRRWRANWLLREDLVMGIFDRQNGGLLGGTGLHRIDWTIRRFEIGYWLRDAYVGKGYVSEAVQVLTRFAFDRLAANRVEIRMDVRNARSRAVPVRLGFVHEGCLRRALPDVEGQPRDIDVFAVVREDYERLSWPAVDWVG
jgi:RimJ/RimL family protein N-acetyltransferase